MQGRIIQNIANLYQIEEQGNIYKATARGKLKKEENIPVVGDFVEFQIIDEGKKEAIIEEIKKRKVYLKRPKLANLTQIICVVSSKNPKPDLYMLDKQLAFAEYLQIKSVIVINKLDLDKKQNYQEIKDLYEKIGYPVIETKANIIQGIEQLRKLMKGNLNAFAGNSGVGKSTLVNAIFQKEMTQEGLISQRNQRGKNTTTATTLYEIEENTYIADTPGFSTFSISEISSKELAHYFKEWVPYLSNCEFGDCTHQKEENCGIKQAMEKGQISKQRYERFCKIYKELKQKEEKRW